MRTTPDADAFLARVRAGEQGAKAALLGRLHDQAPRVDARDFAGEYLAELLAVMGTFSRLGEVDARAADVVRPGIFAGLCVASVAKMPGLSTRWVEREWACVQAWFYEVLK